MKFNPKDFFNCQVRIKIEGYNEYIEGIFRGMNGQWFVIAPTEEFLFPLSFQIQYITDIQRVYPPKPLKVTENYI